MKYMREFEINNLTDEQIKSFSSSLPESIKYISSIIGLECALNIVTAFGGTEMRFPSIYGESRNFKELSELIGIENLKKLHNEYASCEQIYIPSCKRLLNKLKYFEIINKYSEMIKTLSGRESANRLARLYGLSNRRIEIIVNEVYE
jgi:hypothetical protein